MCSIHIQDSKWLVFATPSCAYAYTEELKKGLSLSKLESLKGEWKEDGLPLMKPLQDTLTIWMCSRAMQ